MNFTYDFKGFIQENIHSTGNNRVIIENLGVLPTIVGFIQENRHFT